MLKRVWRKRTLLQCWWDCKWEQPLWRTVRRFFEKLKIELPYDPPVPLLDIYLEKNIIQKDTCTLKFISSVFTVDKTWKQPKCPSTDEWIKMWWVYTMEYYTTIKRTKSFHLQQHGWTWRVWCYVSEISQTEKTNPTWLHFCVESETQDKRETDSWTQRTKWWFREEKIWRGHGEKKGDGD